MVEKTSNCPYTYQKGSGYVAPLTLNLDTRLRCVVNLKSRRKIPNCQLNRRILVSKAGLDILGRR